MNWSRRRMLGALGTGGVLIGSGCAGLTGDDGDVTRTVNPQLAGTPTATQTPAAVPVGRTQRVAGTPVTLTRVGLQEAIIHPVEANEVGLTARAGTRYVFAAVESAAPLDPNEFAIRTDEATFANRDGVPRRTSRKSVNGWGVPYGVAGRTSGYLAFVLPAPLQTDAARIGIQDAAWDLSPDLLAALARPEPSFELVAFDAPAEIGYEEGFSIRIAVRNTGSYRAPFRAVLTGARGPQFTSSTWFTLTLDPDETVEWSQAFGSEWLTPEADELVFRLTSVLGVDTITISASDDG